jgi:hypothetical protein
VAKVVDSTHPGFSAGDIVSGMTGWEDYSLISYPEQLRKIQQKDVPLSYHLGLLGSFLLTRKCFILFLGYIGNSHRLQKSSREVATTQITQNKKTPLGLGSSRCKITL